MSGDKSYNGHANYETWAVSLWLDNDQESHEYWRERTRAHVDLAEEDENDLEQAGLDLAIELRETLEENMPEVEGLWADLLNAALCEVVWYEIAKDWLAEYEYKFTKISRRLKS